MSEPYLEHVNFTVSDPAATAQMLCDLFGWTVRWQGPALDDGVSYHVGGRNSYVAIYSRGGADAHGDSYTTPGAMNHLGVVVDDLDAVEARVTAAGFTPHMHADYEPGRRFYFKAHDDVEIEVVSYA